MTEPSSSPDASPYGPPSPLVPVEQAARRPLTNGFAVVLLAANLLVMGWIAVHQEGRLDEVSSGVSMSASDVEPSGPGLSDPHVCWLLGVVAAGQGRGDEVARMALDNASTSDCATYAGRGARGQDLSGN